MPNKCRMLLHLTYISAKSIFCQLGFCEITYISTIEMYVISFRERISQDPGVDNCMPMAPSNALFTCAGAIAIFRTTRLPLVFPATQKGGCPTHGTPSFHSSALVEQNLSPTRRISACLYAQMVSAASLPEVRAQPLLAPEGLLEPMTAPTTSPQANRPWMDSPALF